MRRKRGATEEEKYSSFWTTNAIEHDRNVLGLERASILLFKWPPSGSGPSLGCVFCAAVRRVSFCDVDGQPHQIPCPLRRRAGLGAGEEGWKVTTHAAY